MDHKRNEHGHPLVTVKNGTLLGRTEGSANVFRGIPYAAPPVGDGRWRAPRPALFKEGVHDAASFCASPPQAGPKDVEDIVSIGGAPEPTHEDCLTLNLWAPTDTATPVPVMVWVHGGSNRMGAGSLPFYDGTSFARDGVLLVTLNYRLGQLGFFAHPALGREEPSQGNQALLDQIAALEWVQENIAAFGGDVNNITLFGESAGGLDILALMTAKRAKGLFHKAIVQSGGGWLPASTLKAALQKGVTTANALGLADPDAAALRQLPTTSLTAIESSFGPVVDGVLLTQDPITAFARGQFADIPLMIGVNSGEDSLLNYGGGLERFGKLVKPTPALAKIYPEANGDKETLIRLGFRDFAFAAPARWVASRPRRSEAFLYAFDYIEEARAGTIERAAHAAEIFHVFETLDQRPDNAPAATAKDRAVSAAMHRHWVQFAKTGRAGPDWPAYQAAEDNWMVFNDTVGGEIRHGWWKRALDHHSKKGRLLVALIGLRDRLGRLFGARMRA